MPTSICSFIAAKHAAASAPAPAPAPASAPAPAPPPRKNKRIYDPYVRVSRDGGKTWTREYVLDKYDTAMEEEMEMLRKEVNVFCEVCNKVMLVDDLKRHTHE
jgi:hypothetical protein